jgi:hypothetical protein
MYISLAMLLFDGGTASSSTGFLHMSSCAVAKRCARLSRELELPYTALAELLNCSPNEVTYKRKQPQLQRLLV